MVHDEAVICESKKIPWKEYDGEINVRLLQWYVREFMANKEKARVLTFDEVKQSRTAYFELGHTDPDKLITINLSHIFTEYKVEDQTLIAEKVWKHYQDWTVERYLFPVENYGRTWRCWSAVPEAEQIRGTKWDV